ncbi:hypothetical protein SMB77_001606 [Cronobacter sakazakii]|nr:hypothetical protein [Cronobacter sakazakii]ELY2632746.1 hypothetical protein [Cronobacter sakazakii]ELY2662980.1 hypothetical protein [Cronobacter sakazakii]ELY4116621.1 hypothetical protein [Cronobacter sakazakii]ELY4499944.1 hypothetical protein [Cronobacter sakazakii]
MQKTSPVAVCAEDRLCADCHQPLKTGEVWVCNECCANYAIWRDPNAYMVGDDEPLPDVTD